MRDITSTVGLITVCGLLAAMPTAAQRRPQQRLPPQRVPTFTISVNGGYQPSSSSFNDRFTFDLNHETASASTDYRVDAGPLFDAAIGFRIWKRLGAAIAISRFVVDSTGHAAATVPHPLFFQRSREISGAATGITREETGIHIQAQYLLPPFGRFYVTLAGGPSVLDIQQSIVTDVNYTEQFPYDTATYVGVDSQRVPGTATGFNAGTDIRWMFTRKIGVGGLVRYTRASVDLTRNGRTVKVDAGGAQVGGGIRLAF